MVLMDFVFSSFHIADTFRVRKYKCNVLQEKITPRIHLSLSAVSPVGVCVCV